MDVTATATCQAAVRNKNVTAIEPGCATRSVLRRSSSLLKASRAAAHCRACGSWLSPVPFAILNMYVC